MIRILVFGITANPGGVESFLMNYYRRMDRSSVQLDFLFNFPEPAAYEAEIVELGGRVFRVMPRRQNRELFRKELEQLFREHAPEWNAIWVNVSSLANIDYLKIAKRYGIEKRIIHSHNSRNMDSRLRGLLHHWNRGKVGKYATDFWACSEEAARWFYNNSLIKKAVVIHNAIDPDRMKYDEGKREKIRSEHGWEGLSVIGNVGRLHFQKNQGFIIDVFREYYGKHPESVLVLVGQGEDEEALKRKVSGYGLEKCVFFAGVQRDIQAWLSSFDLFLFPSKFEGLSISALEAQANGIPILASREAIPVEACINRNCVLYSLEESVPAWAEKVEETRRFGREPFDAVKKDFNENGFDIGTEVKTLERLLLDRDGTVPDC